MGQKANVSHLEVSYSNTCSRQGCIATTDTTQPAVYAKQSKPANVTYYSTATSPGRRPKPLVAFRKTLYSGIRVEAEQPEDISRKTRGQNMIQFHQNH